MNDKTHAPTLRDQFAMSVLTGLAASDGIYIKGRYSGSPLDNRLYSNSVNLVAKVAYEVADAMLKEREK